jgi:Arc/MetJ family transcription regulator
MINNLYTTVGAAVMRTNIEIDDELLSQAMMATGFATKRATVEEGLRLLVRLRKQTKALAELKGLGWEGDLQEMPGPPAAPVMILVDSSVWIAHLRGHCTPATAKLEEAAVLGTTPGRRSHPAQNPPGCSGRRPCHAH